MFLKRTNKQIRARRERVLTHICKDYYIIHQLNQYNIDIANRPENQLNKIIKFNNTKIISVKEGSLNVWDLKTGVRLRLIFNTDVKYYSSIIKLNSKHIKMGYSSNIKNYADKNTNFSIVIIL